MASAIKREKNFKGIPTYIYIAMARSRPTIKVKWDESKYSCQHLLPNQKILFFLYILKDIIRLRYCSKGHPSYLLNYCVNNI